MLIDKNRIEEKVAYIRKNLDKLKDLNSLSKEEFLNDYRNYDSAKYNLHVSIEALLDIANHIISRKEYRVPRSNADTFRILAEEGFLSDKKLSVYMSMAKFRNKVVHLYQEIDEDEIYKIINENLGDFKFFLKMIVEKFLN